MRTTLLLFMVTCMYPFSTWAQSENAQIEIVLKDLFNGMKMTDTTLMRQCFSADATMKSISINKEGATVVTSNTITQFLQAIGQLSKGDADEQIVIKDIHQNGQLASVWATYTFYYKGAFSHCGIDAFHLYKRNDGWKIIDIIDTRSKSGCEE